MLRYTYITYFVLKNIHEKTEEMIRVPKNLSAGYGNVTYGKRELAATHFLS
jgi:hypothetical protein